MRGLELGIGVLLIALGLLVLFIAHPGPARLFGTRWGSALSAASRRPGWRAALIGLSFLTTGAGYGLLLYPYFIHPSGAPSTPPALAQAPTTSPSPPPPAPLRSPEPSPTAPRPTPSPSTPSTPTVSPFACEPGVLQTIEQANAAQEAYIRGQGTLAQLTAAWGDAAAEAQRQGDRLRQLAQAIRATIQEIEWEIRSCTVAARPGPDLLEVQTEETWVYRASLTCPPGQRVTTERVVSYPQEIYRLAAQEGRWRILRWTPGEGRLQRDWRCP